jgi:hypothetical protein
MGPAALSELIRSVTPGHWVAISADAQRVLASAPDREKVQADAWAAGEVTPIIIGVPKAPTPTISAAVPYGLIKWYVEQGNVVPFLGAGASLVGRREGDAYDERQPFLPKAGELMAILAQMSKFPEEELPYSDLARVSSFFEWRARERAPLKSMLRRTLGPIPPASVSRAKPGKIHSLIADEERFKLIITTNYDTLIEDAFIARGRPFDLLAYPAESEAYKNAAQFQRSGATEPTMVEPNQVPVDFSRTVIFKMHGTLAPQPERDAFVITEEDYLEFLARMVAKMAVPTPVLSQLEDKNLLFLGYGLRDWNLRLLLKELNRYGTSFAVQKHVTAVDDRLWDARKIELFQEDLDPFADALREELGR